MFLLHRDTFNIIVIKKSQETGIIINSKIETLVHRHLYLKS